MTTTSSQNAHMDETFDLVNYVRTRVARNEGGKRRPRSDSQLLSEYSFLVGKSKEEVEEHFRTENDEIDTFGTTVRKRRRRAKFEVRAMEATNRFRMEIARASDCIDASYKKYMAKITNVQAERDVESSSEDENDHF